jgi:putative tricarboxylic transport membrane protein
MAETELRRALAVSEGSLGILVGSPITVTLYLVLAAALIGTGGAAPAPPAGGGPRHPR